MKSSSKGRNLIILGVILVVIDQVIKVLVKTNMQIGESIPVLGNWFQLVFVENKGMAFGWQVHSHRFQDYTLLCTVLVDIQARKAQGCACRGPRWPYAYNCRSIRQYRRLSFLRAHLYGIGPRGGCDAWFVCPDHAGQGGGHVLLPALGVAGLGPVAWGACLL